MITISGIQDIIKGQTRQNQFFFYPYKTVTETSNSDGSYLGILNMEFSSYPDDDKESDIYIEESNAFETRLIDELESLGIELQELNSNSHYFYNQDGDTISIHFNDTSLMVIITMTGQY